MASYERFRDVAGSEMAAALAYRVAAALFPFLIFVTGMIGLIVSTVGGEEPAQQAISEIDGALSDRVAQGAERQLRQVVNTTHTLPIMAGFVATIWTALIGGQSVVRHLNKIHDIEEHRSKIRVGLVSLTVSLGSSFAALLAVIVLLIGAVNPGIPGVFGVLVDVLRWPVAFAILTAAAALTYDIAPARSAGLPAISIGAILFGITWTVSSGLLVLYVSNVGAFAQTYGALTGVVALLIWVYLTGLAYVIGAVVDAELEDRRG